VANGTGSAVIDFGASPGSNEAFVDVAGQASILATSHVEAWPMAEAQGTHTVSDATYAPLFIAYTCGVPTAGVGFRIYGRSFEKMTGQFKVRWVWSD
jgi:hypothetical protein